MLRIQITGPANTGKTTIALLIEKTLREHGFNVRNVDPDVAFATVAKPILQEEKVRAAAAKSRSSSIIIETGQPEVHHRHHDAG